MALSLEEVAFYIDQSKITGEYKAVKDCQAEQDKVADSSEHFLPQSSYRDAVR